MFLPPAPLLHSIPSSNSFVRYCPSSSITGIHLSNRSTIHSCDHARCFAIRRQFLAVRQARGRFVARLYALVKTHQSIADLPQWACRSPTGASIADLLSDCIRDSSHVNDHTRRSCGRKVFPGIFTRRLLGRGQGETPALGCHLGW